jgi:Tfp pilus assembly protein PilW
MASMISITPSNRKATFSRGRAGLTLVELLIAASLSIIILGGVMTSFILIVKSGYATSQYTDMELQSRKGLEYFARDVRMASAIDWSNWNTDASIALTIPTSSATDTITYRYIAASKTFTRFTASTNQTQTLFSNIASFDLIPYNITGASIPLNNLSEATQRTKQLQLTLVTNQSRTLMAKTTNTVLSARFILRNKKVTS